MLFNYRLYSRPMFEHAVAMTIRQFSNKWNWAVGKQVIIIKYAQTSLKQQWKYSCYLNQETSDYRKLSDVDIPNFDCANIKPVPLSNLLLQVTWEPVSVLQVTWESESGNTSYAHCTSTCNEIEGSYDKITFTIVPSYTGNNCKFPYIHAS